MGGIPSRRSRVPSQGSRSSETMDMGDMALTIDFRLLNEHIKAFSLGLGGGDGLRVCAVVGFPVWRFSLYTGSAGDGGLNQKILHTKQNPYNINNASHPVIVHINTLIEALAMVQRPWAREDARQACAVE